MTYTSGLTLGNTPPARDASLPEPATSAIPATSNAQATMRAVATQNAAVDSVATDSAKLNMAGTMLSQAATGSDVRFDKVAELRQSIESGAYNPPSTEIASKLIETLKK